MPGDGGSTLSTSLLADQRRRWAHGDRVSVEQYVKHQPSLTGNTEALLDLIYAEVVLRRERGEKPSADEYVARFPDLAESIQTQFEVDAVIDTEATQLAGTDDPVVDFTVAQPKPPPGYQLLEELGRGGMGVVFKARQIGLDRLVALKMIRSGELADPVERARFEEEARAIGQLSHPNIIQVYEVGKTESGPFLALEYIPGDNLAESLRDSPLPSRAAATLMATVARAIQHAHEAGVVHRDLKPANILLASSQSSTRSSQSDTQQLRPGETGLGTPKVTDFGLAKRLGADGPTRTGDFLGTPNFTAPEQAAGMIDVGPAADVYSLGAILYQMLTGHPPFLGATPLETLDLVRFAEPVPPSRIRPNVPRDLETIAVCCLQKEPKRRYRSAAALADDLERFTKNEPIQARPVGAIEKARKWCRRRPAVACMIAAMVLLITASLITVTLLWQRAIGARNDERQARARETAERERVESRSADLLIANARFAWLTDDIESAKKSLSECSPEYRNSDWATLNRACSASRLLVPPGDAGIETIAVSRDSNRIAAGTVLGRVVVWDSQSGAVVAEIHRFAHAFQSLSFMPDGRVAAVADVAVIGGPQKGKVTGAALIVDPSDATAKQVLEVPERPQRFLVSPDGRRVAWCGWNSKLCQVHDAESGQLQHKIESKAGNVMRVAFSPDGRFLALATLPRDLTTYDMESGAKRPNFKCTEVFFGFYSLALAPDGEIAAVTTGTSVKNAEIQFVQVGADASRFDSQMPQIAGSLYSPDGRWFAYFGSPETIIRVWNVQAGREEMILRGHPTGVRCAAFSADSRRLVAGYRDGRIVMWDIQSPK
jgi:serine/threonine protein kinase/WD40 repeat protein